MENIISRETMRDILLYSSETFCLADNKEQEEVLIQEVFDYLNSLKVPKNGSVVIQPTITYEWEDHEFVTNEINRLYKSLGELPEAKKSREKMLLKQMGMYEKLKDFL